MLRPLFESSSLAAAAAGGRAKRPGSKAVSATAPRLTRTRSSGPAMMEA
jgi:hypothetical protein